MEDISMLKNTGSLDKEMDTNLLYDNGWSVPSTYPYFWPNSGVTSFQYSKYEHAFKVARMLVEKGHVPGMTLKEFIELVESIEKQL